MSAACKGLKRIMIIQNLFNIQKKGFDKKRAADWIDKARTYAKTIVDCGDGIVFGVE